ncbi:hypothetical protein L227DRAFT_336400 [Lentinus tigrinus ALCF2SS1-6]|uniref:Uncharacterized protein n=1 Tax=Lentinus tigrinus ALCF2SS1-6 TaxID=1328759 RepID=A0A5C2RVD4_9APHY|nr:hypothetical protein L227DRAFT_336400 [Lentinus tigrinus ALCF2SS1-6]
MYRRSLTASPQTLGSIGCPRAHRNAVARDTRSTRQRSPDCPSDNVRGPTADMTPPSSLGPLISAARVAPKAGHRRVPTVPSIPANTCQRTTTGTRNVRHTTHATCALGLGPHARATTLSRRLPLTASIPPSPANTCNDLDHLPRGLPRMIRMQTTDNKGQNGTPPLPSPASARDHHLG